MTALRICLAAGYASGVCHTLLPSDIPTPAPLPAWATDAWVYNAAGIVAGETVHDCVECDLWIGCAVVEDVTKRGYHPWRLRPAGAGEPGRWYGWREPGARHLAVIRAALGGGCTDAPNMRIFGKLE